MKKMHKFRMNKTEPSSSVRTCECYVFLAGLSQQHRAKKNMADGQIAYEIQFIIRDERSIV